VPDRLTLPSINAGTQPPQAAGGAVPESGLFRRDVAGGMLIEWDVAVPAGDGLLLRGDVFRPVTAGRYPVLLSYGPYAKGLPFQLGYPSAWQAMLATYPEVGHHSTGRYQNWEVVDPEKWVPEGYVCVRVDARGSGRSPGYLDPFSAREIDDLHECIEWAAGQPWSTGRVGLNGISYYAMNQWLVAARQPPALAAICVWEGSADWYRDATHHGGIRTTFWDDWYDMQVTSVQHGLGERGPRNPHTGQLVCGDQTLTDDELAANRVELADMIRSHPFEDDYHRQRTPAWEHVIVPVLSAGNWGGQGLHLRGNTTGFERAASAHKWLEMHGDTHWSLFYADYGLQLQQRFFGRFLKDIDTGWDQQPRVQLQVRHVEGRFGTRTAQAWPLPDTQWTPLYLSATDRTLRTEPPGDAASISYRVAAEGITFAYVCPHDVEIAGPLAAKLYLESATTDADIFLVVRAQAPDGEEIVFQGALDPHTPIAQGWLRASHRALDEQSSRPYKPVHPHHRADPLRPGQIYELDIEILPTSLVLPAGYTLLLSVQGGDYVYPGPAAALSNLKNPLTGCGPFLHDDPGVRPAGIYDGTVTLHSGGAYPSYLLLPVLSTT